MDIPHTWRRLVALGGRSLLAALLLVLLVGATQAAQAANIVVNSAEDTTIEDDDKCTLREAILNANADGDSTAGDCTGGAGEDTITFAPSLGASPMITLTQGQLPKITSAVVISGAGQVTVDADGASRHFWIDASGVLTLDGLRLVNGDVSNDMYNTDGGAIYNWRGTLALIHTRILSSTAYYGGGIYNAGGQVSVIGGEIVANTASSGGGFFNTGDGSQVTLTNTRILSNRASDGGGGGFVNTSGGQVSMSGGEIRANSAGVGGGFANTEKGSQITLTNTLILSNTASSDGGGFYNFSSGQVSVIGGEIRANTANGAGGGGFYNEDAGSRVTLTDTRILSNMANGSDGGGGFYNVDGGQVSMSGGELRANKADDGGGGGFANTDASSQVTLTDTFILSNTASYGGGFANVGQVTLIHTWILSNTADDGGGFVNVGQVTLTNSLILSNTANGVNSHGGGFSNQFGGQVSMDGGELRANTATAGGGFANVDAGSQVTLTNTIILSNTAAGTFSIGGGFANGGGGQVSVSGGEIRANTANGAGGGFYNSFFGQVNLTGSEITNNIANTNGGGFYNEGSQVTLTDTQLLSNTAQGGGGFYNTGISSPPAPPMIGQVSITNTRILSNSAQVNGGGFYNTLLGQASLEGSELVANIADNDGGGFFNGDPNGNGSQVTLTNTLILSNTAGRSGGGFYNGYTGDVDISQSCIVANSPVAVVHDAAAGTQASSNWWGAPSGPSGEGAGYGDSVGPGIQFTPFLAQPPEGCPARPLPLSLHKTVHPDGPLLPGQPVSYTLTVSNTSALTLTAITLQELPPAAFQLHQATPPAQGEMSWQIDELRPGQSAMIQVMGQITTSFSADQPITNTAAVSSSVLGEPVTSVVSSLVSLPRLSWKAPSVSALESGGRLSLTVQLLPTTPYVTVTVEYATQDGAALAGMDYLAAGRVLTFAPGVSEQTVSVTLLDDAQLEGSEAFTLTLSNPQEASLDHAHLRVEVLDDESGLSLGPAHLSLLEGDDGATRFTYMLTRTGWLEAPAVVSYTVSGGAGVNEEDFVGGALPSGMLSWTSGVMTRALVIEVAGERLVEADEAFTLTLSNPQGVTLLNTTATGQILNDDSELSLGPGQLSQVEGDSGSTLYRYELTRTGYLTGAASVGYVVSGGAGVSGADFAGGVLPSGTVVWPAGVITQPLVIAVAGETLVEADEAFTLTLSNAQGTLVLLDETVTGKIINDDQASLHIHVAESAHVAALGQVSAVTFTVSLSGSVDAPVSVAYATTDGTAKAPEDYVAVSGRLDFSGLHGEQQMIVVQLNPQRNAETPKQFALQLSDVLAAGRAVTLASEGVATATLPVVPDEPSEPNEPDEPGERQLFLPSVQS